MKKLLIFLLGLLASPALAQTGVSTPQLASCDAVVQKFMERWKIPGATVAISRQGKLVYSRGFGYADLGQSRPMEPSNLLRVASVSKPVTSIAIMKLMEAGRLELQHKAFGPEGYLHDDYYTSVIKDKRIYDITVQQLLEHSAGWNRNAGVDGFESSDPIDFPLHVAQVMRVPNPVGDSTLVRFLLSKGLNFKPGTRFSYSNIGYLVLGKIIEKITGQRYETWVRQNVLVPSGVLEAHLGHNLLADKLEREAEYFCPTTKKSCYGTGKKVPYAYGGANLEAMNAHGGWLFTARDLVRLLLAVDGSPTRPDILLPSTLDTMTTPSQATKRYAKGWMVNKHNVWWHTGCLNGSTSILARNSEGYTWAVLLNSCPNTNRFWNEVEALGWDCINSTNDWPTHDLFQPEQNAQALRLTATTTGTATLRWHNGNGTHRLVLLREDQPVNAFPLDGRAYASGRVFGQGDELGAGNRVVSAGADSTVRVSGLRPGRTYYARVVEYKLGDETSQQPVYTLEGNPILQFRTAVEQPVVKVKRSAKSVASKGRLIKPVKRITPAPAKPESSWPADQTAHSTSPLLHLRSLLNWRKG